MHIKIIALLACLAVMANGAAIPVKVAPISARQGRTLGLITVGANAIGAGLGAAGAAATTAVGTVAAAKPLILLGLGKYALWNYLNRPGHGVQMTVGYNSPHPGGHVVVPNGGNVYYDAVDTFDDGFTTVDAFPTGAFEDNSEIVYNNGW